jgi:ankyrin repeat protein
LHGFAALIGAVRNDHNRTAEFLIEKCDDPVFSVGPILTLTKMYDKEKRKAYFVNGWSQSDSLTGTTPLLLAIENGFFETTELLLKNGADVNSKNTEGQTLLICASIHGKSDAVRFLIERGVDVNLRDNSGNTALIWASQMGDTKIVNILLDKGADPNIQDNFGQTALAVAKKRGRTEVVNLIEEKQMKETQEQEEITTKERKWWKF